MNLQIASSSHKVLKVLVIRDFFFKVYIIFKQIENAKIWIEKNILLYLISILQIMLHIYLKLCNEISYTLRV